ncbi:MAG: AtpZ/AtpI family protein [Lachnospiraceae bacterium]|nr:AtpZ/AtpI family protein [Lachnospiraceae bacterium]
MKSNKDSKKKSEFTEVARGLSMILQIGINMMVPIGMCLVIGYYLDRWLETGYMIIVFLFLGIAAGVRSVYDITKRFYAKDLEMENINQQYYKDLYKERDANISRKRTDSGE